MDEIVQFDFPTDSPKIIKVIGVGGGGGNAVNHMYREGIHDVTFVLCNTDNQALAESPVPVKLQLGRSITQGLGAGNRPERARDAAEESIEDIKAQLNDGTKMVFITAGMGGGTGTGAAPVIARIAKEMDILTVGIVTIPFIFEGEKKIIQALDGVERIAQHVDALLVINNERLREIYADLTFMNAFGKADDTLSIAAKSIAEIITMRIIRKGISLQPKVQPGVRVYTYSRDEGDFHAENIRIGNGEIFIDFVAPDTRINDIQLGIPVSINIENGVAAMALAHLNGVTDEEIKRGMASFRGVDRRFDFKLKNDRIVFLSDYAHHPSEIKQSVLSMRELYKDKKITAIFQPHLYTRTRDFYQDFADSLSLLDEVILVDIYPAREAPIPGVTSKLIYDNLRPGIEKSMCKKEDILNILKDKNIEVLITLGAGDIDNYVPEIKELLETKKLRMNNEE